MDNLKNFLAASAFIFATSALAGGPEPRPLPVKDSGFYINANAGLIILSASNPWNTTGWNAGFAAGYHWGGVRFELASNYLQNTAASGWRNFLIPATVNGVATGGGTFSFSHLQLWNLMANLYYDFHFGHGFVPFLGFGLGALNLQSTLTFTGSTVFNGVVRPSQFRGNNTQFAIQGIIGLDYVMTEHVRLGVNYHALGWSNNTYYRNFLLVNNGAVSGINFNSSSFENLINLSLSYYF